MADAPKVSSGVQELIGRLRDEGVQAGQQEAERRVAEAKAKATEIVEKAKTEAAAILSQARADIEAERNAAREAIQLAVRDTKLKLTEELMGFFKTQVRRLVSMEMRDREFLRQLILAIAGSATSNLCRERPVELHLSSDLFIQDTQRTEFSPEGKKHLNHFLAAIADEMLRAGIELKPSSAVSGGIRVRLLDEDLEIDLSDEAIAELLLKHLTPRFRSVVQGLS